MSAVFLTLATPLAVGAFFSFLNSAFTVPDSFQSMFPTCDIEVRTLGAELNNERGMVMLMVSMVLMVIINAWHLYMTLIFHRPAGTVVEVFHMPDLKHYKKHYSKEDQAAFRKRHRDQKESNSGV